MNNKAYIKLNLAASIIQSTLCSISSKWLIVCLGLLLVGRTPKWFVLVSLFQLTQKSQIMEQQFMINQNSLFIIKLLKSTIMKWCNNFFSKNANLKTNFFKQDCLLCMTFQKIILIFLKLKKLRYRLDNIWEMTIFSSLITHFFEIKIINLPF